ncbi:MAG: urate hydroxylase PuuD, partial [Xanthomonadales bacterium]|nr:urate hydroxylase PuuD [Xanthomonadales bacterium]
PRALWWFRWGAMFTFLSGVALIGLKHLTGWGILLGGILGTFMFLNVWLIIWPNQKIVIASAEKVAGGGEADPAAAGALAKAGLASRTNTLFSIPMLFFMASSVHLAQLMTASTAAKVVSLAIVIALEINGIFGKQGPMTSVKGVIHMGLLLTLVLYLAVDLL